MTVVACYTGEEVRKFLQGAKALNPKMVKGGKMVYVKKVGKTDKMEIAFLIVPVGAEIITHGHPEKVKTETYESLTRSEDGTLITISEDCLKGQTHNLKCIPDQNNSGMICAIVKSIKYFE